MRIFNAENVQITEVKKLQRNEIKGQAKQEQEGNTL